MSRSRAPGAFPDVVHLLVGASPAGSLRSAGARTVLYCDDWLAWGAVAADPAEHRVLRASFWGQADPGCDFDSRVLGAAVAAAVRSSPKPRPVVIWTSDTWSARLALLWLCGALAGEPAEAGATVYLVDVRRPRRPSERGRYGSSYELGEYNADQLRQAFSAATRLGRPTIRAGAALWRKYADPDPTAFDRSRRAGFPGIRLLNSVSDCYGVLFPRRVRGRIDLSILDAALLSYFLEKGPRKWHSLAAISGWMFTRGRYISEALGSERCIGDRLAMWASRSPVIDSGGATTSGPGRYPIYRLTDAGRLAAREARGWVPIAPAVFVGGCKAYDPDRLWVRSGTRRRWRVERGG